MTAIAPAHREPPGRQRDQARRRPHDPQRHDDRSAQHRRRGPSGPGRRAQPGRRGQARRHHRRRDADRGPERRPGRRGRCTLRHRPTSSRDRFAPRASAAASRSGACRSSRPLRVPHRVRRRRHEEHRQAAQGGIDRRRRCSCGASPTGKPWAHLDIAGPARSEAAHGYITKGATAFSPRTLLEYLRRSANSALARAYDRFTALVPRDGTSRSSELDAGSFPSPRPTKTVAKSSSSLSAGPAQDLVAAAKVAPERRLPAALFEQEQERHGRHRRVGVPVGQGPGRAGRRAPRSVLSGSP